MPLFATCTRVAPFSVLTIKRSEILVIGEAGVVSRADGMRVIARVIAGDQMGSVTASSPANVALRLGADDTRGGAENLKGLSQ